MAAHYRVKPGHSARISGIPSVTTYKFLSSAVLRKPCFSIIEYFGDEEIGSPDEDMTLVFSEKETLKNVTQRIPREKSR